MAEPTVYPKKILLKGRLNEVREEYRAAAAITPGHLIEVHTDGKVRKHSTDAARGRTLIAIEDGLLGRTIDDAYAQDELVQCHDAQPGDVIYGWVAAGAAAIGTGIRVKSAGDGTFEVTGNAADHIFGTAEEGVDNSGGGTAVRIKVRIV